MIVISFEMAIEGVARSGGIVMRMTHDAAAFLDVETGTSPYGCNACELWDTYPDLTCREGCPLPALSSLIREVMIDVF